MKPLDLHTEAETEVREAYRHYEEKDPSLSEAFLVELENTFQFISDHPKAGGFFQDTAFRKRTMNRFPFVVYYRESEEAIWVIAVAHGKRRPGYWLGRNN